jgi:hypothetical protein
MAEAVSQPDPVTTNLLNAQSSQLASLSGVVQGMGNQINALTSSMRSISQALSVSQSLERQKAEQEQMLENRLAQQQLREGKESAIEKKIQAATVAPAQKLAGKAQQTLGSLSSIMLSLIGGWLAVQTVKFLGAASEGNTKKMNSIKSNLLTTLGVIAGVYVAGKLGLGLLSAGFLRFGKQILLVGGVGMAASLFADPIRQLLDAVVSWGGKAWEGLTSSLGIGGGNEEDSPSSPPSSGGGAPAAEGGPEGAAPAPAPAAPTAAGSTTTTATPAPEKSAEVSAAKPVDASVNFNMSAETTTTGPLSFTSSVNNNFLGIENKSTTADPTNKDNVESSKPAPEPSALPPGFAGESLDLSSALPTDANMSSTAFSPSSSPTPSLVGQNTYSSNLSFSFTPVKTDAKVAEAVSQPPKEPPVTVVPISSPAAPVQQQEKPAASGKINNAPPVFPTHNSDNIYVLGAYSNYNVVPA